MLVACVMLVNRFLKKEKKNTAGTAMATPANVATTVKQWGITDLIVWNEPNTRLYWFPQKDAAGNDVAGPAYEALLAKCYDAIKVANLRPVRRQQLRWLVPNYVLSQEFGERTREFVRKFLAAFAKWVETQLAGAAASG